MSFTYDAATPLPGFVVKLKAADRTLHYVNICSHPTIERPLDGRDKEVDDTVLRTRGLDNLRVPLLTGLPRTVVMADGESEAVCIDVVFAPSVLAAALHGEEHAKHHHAAAADASMCVGLLSSPGPAAALSPELIKFMRVRLVELALKNAEEDLGYKLPRGTHTLPRGVSYKGGVAGKQGQPVPMPQLRKFSAAVAAKKKHEAAATTAPGPWRSKRDAAGLSTSGKIQELDRLEDDRADTPLMKKGFLNSTRGEIYPEGSSEGMLYGDVKTAGDPLGYLPKGLRSRVNVVDTATTSDEAQMQMMQNYADNKPVQASATGGSGSAKGAKPTGASGHGTGGGVSKGFLNQKGGSLYPDGSKEGSGNAPTDMDALREMLPSEDAIKKMAEETDPNAFMAELAEFGSILGLGPDANGSLQGMPNFATPNAHPVMDVSDNSSFTASKTKSSTAAATPAPPSEAAPTYEMTESDGSLALKISLPDLSSLEEAEVEISERNFYLRAPGKYRLQLEWPQAISADDAKAKFLRKKGILQVTLPLVV